MPLRYLWDAGGGTLFERVSVTRKEHRRENTDNVNPRATRLFSRVLDGPHAARWVPLNATYLPVVPPTGYLGEKWPLYSLTRRNVYVSRRLFFPAVATTRAKMACLRMCMFVCVWGRLFYDNVIDVLSDRRLDSCR